MIWRLALFCLVVASCTSSTSLLAAAQIADATAHFVPSTESTYDHMVELEDNLYFHWNDIMGGDKFLGRLIHTADSIQQAPSWLAFGVYHSNHNYTVLPTNQFMVGSNAIIGMVTTTELPTAATHYHLGGQMVDMVNIIPDDTSFTDATVVQHDSDTGSVTTDLTFTKSMQGTTVQGSLRREGTNVFLWAVGPPGGIPGQMGKHSLKGAIYLDLMQVQNSVEGGNGGSGNGGGGISDPNPPTEPPVDTPPERNEDPAYLDSIPVIRGKCDSSLLSGKDTGQVNLTPTLNFHWKLVGGGTKVQIVLEYTGEEAWLGVAVSLTGKMIGSSAVIGSPGTDTWAIPPTHYHLQDQAINGVLADASVLLEDAKITSEPASDGTAIVTILRFTKTMNDPNDVVPITTGLTTFLYAVGDSRQLAYHEHRGAFRLDLEDCGGTIVSDSDVPVWTHHKTFAAHGVFATLAFGLATPFAVSVALFRTLVPASWIYIHVFANVFSFLLTLLAFATVMVGVSNESAASHFSRTHHWVGLLLVFAASFQVINGFLRPPVQRKDPSATDNNLAPEDNLLFGKIALPTTPRDTWQWTHRGTGAAAVLMGVYQIQSGLGLYADRFQTDSIVNYYWFYIAVFLLSLAALRGWVFYEEDKARRGVMQVVSTTEPGVVEEQRSEEPDTLGSPTVEDGTMT